MGFHKNLSGSDLHAPSNETVQNDTASQIDSLKVVQVAGVSTSGYPIITTSSGAVAGMRGILRENIAATQTGIMAVTGIIRNLDTTLWTVDTLLYSDVNGDLSSTPLGEPIARVLESDATIGAIYINGSGTFGLKNYERSFVIADWTDDGDTAYIDIVHGLNKPTVETDIYESGIKVDAMSSELLDTNTVRIRVSLAGVDMKFDGVIKIMA